MSALLPPFALTLIGIGAGNPAHLTQEAAAAMRAAHIILLPQKGDEKAQLAALRTTLCATVLTGPLQPVLAPFDMPQRASEGAPYLHRVADWHAAIALRWQAATGAAWAQMPATQRPPAGQALQVALLVWGDPCLYDSTLRIAQRLPQPPASLRVVPGITALQSLCAAHAIALNDVGQPFHVTTGRQLREHGWPADCDTAVVLLDGQCSFNALPPQLAAQLHIWWGAYLGMPQQLLDSGPLPEAAPRIARTRAQARAQHGWVMDTYLLRRQRSHAAA